MTAAVLRSSPNLAIPQTQNTAPVYEFNCLYTHDLRRKQKRWQDGFLRYHTFNKRVMVYDVPRNFLGDIHWTYGEELREGDEMTLDKGGIMVQVAERVATTETDISSLLQRKDKTPAKPTPGSAISLKHRTPHSLTSSLISRPNFSTSQAQGKHKSLTALLGNSRRPIGKASVPVESPFDLRKKVQENAAWESGREIKRQKTDRHETEPATTLASTVSNKKSTNLPTTSPRRVPDIIDISSDTEDILQTHRSDNIEAELLSTSSPNRLDSPAIRPATQPVPRHKPALRTIESPSVRMQQRTRVVPSPAPVIAPPERRASAPRDVRPPDANKSAGESRSLQKSTSYSSGLDHQKRGKSLKLVGGAPRKMLVVQSRISRGSSSAIEPEPITPQETILEKDLLSTREASKSDQKPTETTYRRRMQERLAQLAKKQRMALSGGAPDSVEQISDGDTAVETAPKKRKPDQQAHPKAPVRSRKTPVADVPPLGYSHMDLDVPVTDTIPVRKEALPRSKPLPRDMYARPKPNNMPPPLESAIMHRPFKPPGAKEAASDNESKDFDDGEANADLGPWSKEAFDLMDWRPPDRDANGVKLGTA